MHALLDGLTIHLTLEPARLDPDLVRSVILTHLGDLAVRPLSTITPTLDGPTTARSRRRSPDPHRAGLPERLRNYPLPMARRSEARPRHYRLRYEDTAPGCLFCAPNLWRGPRPSGHYAAPRVEASGNSSDRLRCHRYGRAGFSSVEPRVWGSHDATSSRLPVRAGVSALVAGLAVVESSSATTPALRVFRLEAARCRSTIVSLPPA